MMKLKPWHCRILLALAVLVVYYPSLHAGYNSVDDMGMIDRISNAGPVNIRHLFFPHGTGYYYRPLTILTFFFDRFAWGTIPSFMHLENILIHLGSVLLVFAITRRIASLYDVKGQGVAFFAGLLFALHPLATEAVCWISDRTDLLSGLLVLMTLWLMIAALQEHRKSLLLMSGVTLLFGCLAKETAVFVLPGLLWFVVVFPEKGIPLVRRLRRRWLALGMPTLAITVYFIMRHMALARDTGIKTALTGVITSANFDLLNKTRVALKVYGFYFKKLFVPWPLNFAIIEVSNWYVLGGILLVVVLCWLAIRADLLGALGLMGFCVLSPALLVPFSRMAWTPIGERYLYVTIALVAPLAAILIFQQRKRLAPFRQRWAVGALTLLLAVFFTTTLHRAWIWQNNVRLYTDTSAKSPDFVAAKTELASALIARGRTAEAQAILAALHEENNSGGYVVDDLNFAQVLTSQGKLKEARKVLLGSIDKNPKERYQMLQALLKVNDLRCGKTTDLAVRLKIQKESLAWLYEEQKIRPQTFTLYRIAKQQLAMGHRKEALKSFKDAYARAPENAFYRGAAATFIKRLEGS